MLLNYSKSNGWGGVIGNFAKGIKNSSSDSPLVKSNTEDFLNSVQGQLNNKTLDINSLKRMKGYIGEVNENAYKLAENLANGTTQLKKGETALSRFRSESSALSGVWAGIKNLGAQFVSTVVNGFVSMGASIAISAIVSGITQLITSFSDLSKKLNEATQKYKTTKEETANYAKQVKDLRGKLVDSKTTTTEAKDATKQLYDIQRKLVSTYGEYAAGIDLVNGKLESQLDILNEIEKKSLQDWENEVKDQKSAKSTAVSLGAKYLGNLANPMMLSATYAKDIISYIYAKVDGEENAFKKTFGGKTFFGVDWGEKIVGNGLTEAINKYEKFNDTIKATDNDKINELIDSFDGFELVGDEIEISGNIKDISDSVTTLQVELKNLGYQNETLDKQLTNIANKTKKRLKDTADIYETNTYSEIVQNEERLEMYNKLKSAYDEWQVAVDSGDQSKIDKATKGITSALTTIDKSNIADKYKEYLQDLYPDIQNIVSDWKVKYQIVPEIDETELEKYLQNNSTESIISEYNKYILTGNYDKQYAEFFEKLRKYARITGYDIDQLITKLHTISDFKYSPNLKKLLINGQNTSSKNYISPYERQNIVNIGVEDYRDEIESGTLQTKYGNVDMNNRKIIEWNEENIEKFKEELKTWGTAFDEQGNMIRSYYDDLSEGIKLGEKSIDTVWGNSDSFNWGGKSHDIAFTPILQTENGAVFLSHDQVYDYIESVIDKAAEDDGKISIDEIFEIDAVGAGKKYGKEFGKGLIAGIDESTGSGGALIPAKKTSGLMHFSGDFGGPGIETNTFKQTNLGKILGNTITSKEQQYNKDVNAWYEKLSPESQDAFDELDLSDEQIDVFLKLSNDFERDNWLYNMLKDGKAEVEVDITTVDEGINALDELEDRIDKLGTLYDNTVNKTDSSGNATTGVPSASDLADIHTEFGGQNGTTKDENGKYITMAGSLQTFDTAVTENIGNVVKQKDAYNNLITSSIVLEDSLKGLTDNLDDVTEAEKNSYIQMLKNKGITNAQEVVESRLNKTYKKTRENIVALNNVINDNRDALLAGEDAGEDYDNAISNIKDQVNQLFGTYDEDGNVIAADLDEDFIKANFDDINEAAQGSQEAIDKVYTEIAKVNAEKILVEADMDDTQFNATKDNIDKLVDMASKEDVTIDALMQDEQFKSTLNSVISSGESAVDALNAAFATLGFKAEYKKTKTQKLKAASFNNVNSSTDYRDRVQNGQQTVTNTEVEVDDFELVTTSTGKANAGSTAKYGGSTTNNNTNSGGSGDSGSSNDNDASEHTAETFDWIEVALTRVEEEIDRLDDKVNNVYSKWGDRNEALKDEIDKVTEEIEDQNQAYSEYMSYANGVKVNNGVTKVNDDDYGDDDTKQKEYDQAQLDRAIELWNSGEYQEKVRKGLLTDTDIENIQNDYLKDAINSYKSYYESAIQAKDKVAELEEEVSKLNKQKFDNIKDEFDDLITNITKKTDLIEERISRAEKKGYFVSTNYYQQELELEEQNRQTLLEKRKKLTKQLNESVKNGSIKEGSEAFNEMKQSIMDVNAELEKSATNTVELANAMRQIQWDKWEFWQDQVSRATTEAQNLIDLVSTRTEAYDDKGYFNNNSYTQAALHGAKINVLEDQRAQHLAHIKQLQADLSKEENKGNKDLLEQLQKEIDGYNEKTKAISDEEQAIKSLVQEGINAYISSLNELISKYKDSLSAAKDLYTYQNNIADQTKKIASLEKQLTAYEGDDSEETRKRRQELQTQLEDAQRSLEETQWDRYISQTGDMLDKTSEKVEKYLNEKAKDIVEVMRSVKAAVDANKQAVEDELNDIKATYEPYLKYFNKFAKNNGELYELLGEDSTINKGVSSIEKILGKVYDTIKTYTNVNSEKKTGQAGKNDVNVKKSNETKGIQGVDNIVIDGQSPKIVQKTGDSNYQWVKDDKGYKYQNKNDGSDYNTNYFLTLDKKKYYLDKNGYMVKGWKKIENRWFYFKKDGSMAYSEWETIDGKKYYFNDKGIMVTGKQEIEGKKYTFGKNGVYKKKGWRKGTANVPKTDLYWTNENASELIYRTTDGAILTPLNAGDMVFNHDQMKALYEMSLEQANNGAASIGNSLSSVRKTSNTNNLSINVEQVIANDPMEFAERLRETIKNDTRTDKLIKQITIGEMTGGNTLTKNRY